MKITHLSVYKIHQDNIFGHVHSYDEMIKTIQKYGKQLEKEGDPNYANHGWGMPFEIFTQFFCIYFGHETFIECLNILDTSTDPFTEGFDFTFERRNKDKGIIQSKFTTDNLKTFMNTATFSEQADLYDVENGNRIWFTSINDHEILFDYKKDKLLRKKIKIFDRKMQEEFILRRPEFWDQLRKCIQNSCISNYEDAPKNRDIQDWILNGNKEFLGTNYVMDLKHHKGRIEAATSSGKSLCAFKNFYDLFHKYDEQIGIMVMPTRALIDQMFNDFYKWKMFLNSNISCLIIRSGNTPRYNELEIDFKQTTKINEIKNYFEHIISNNRKLLVLITSDSQDLKYESIIEELEKHGVQIGLEIVDEYHTLVRSSETKESAEEFKQYLVSSENRAKRTLFYSASNKTGKLISTTNEELFGPLLAKVTYNDLRLRGFVTPKVKVKYICIQNSKTKIKLQQDAANIGVDIKEATKEAAGIIIAKNDADKIYHDANLMTFGNHVEGCRHISQDAIMQEYLPEVNHHFVYGGTENNERSIIFDKIRNSNNNILHQHSVAGVGINITNLHGLVINRDLELITIQQGIGRAARANPQDTKDFEAGKLKLDDPTGWRKYYSLIYILVNEQEFENYKFFKNIVRYLETTGIPEDEFDIQAIKVELNSIEHKFDLDFAPNIIRNQVEMSKKQLTKILKKAELENAEEDQNEEFLAEQEKIHNMSDDELFESLI